MVFMKDFGRYNHFFLLELAAIAADTLVASVEAASVLFYWLRFYILVRGSDRIVITAVSLTVSGAVSVYIS